MTFFWNSSRRFYNVYSWDLLQAEQQLSYKLKPLSLNTIFHASIIKNKIITRVCVCVCIYILDEERFTERLDRIGK